MPSHSIFDQRSELTYLITIYLTISFILSFKLSALGASAKEIGWTEMHWAALAGDDETIKKFNTDGLNIADKDKVYNNITNKLESESFSVSHLSSSYLPSARTSFFFLLFPSSFE